MLEARRTQDRLKCVIRNLCSAVEVGQEETRRGIERGL